MLKKTLLSQQRLLENNLFQVKSMPASSSSAWVVWLVITTFLLISIGVIFWVAIDSPKVPTEHLG